MGGSSLGYAVPTLVRRRELRGLPRTYPDFKGPAARTVCGRPFFLGRRRYWRPIGGLAGVAAPESDGAVMEPRGEPVVPFNGLTPVAVGGAGGAGCTSVMVGTWAVSDAWSRGV